jgi:uncharacterized membrane protein
MLVRTMHHRAFMNAAHLHIILVHLPIILVPTATIILATGMLIKQSAVTSVALSLFVVATLFSIPAFLIGEEAEEIIEHLPGISEDVIEKHQEAAEVAFWLTLFVGGGALGTLAIRNPAPSLSHSAMKLLILTGTAASASLAYTGYEGGKIRHPEAYDNTLASETEDRDNNDDD